MMGMAAVGAVTSVMAAQQKNKAIEQSMATNRKYAMERRGALIDRRGVLQRQTLAARDAETLKTMRQAQQLRGSIRNSGAASGIAVENRLVAQADIDEAQNLGILNTNTSNRLMSADIDYKSANLENMASYSNNINAALSQGQNALLAGITGGIGGLSSGVGIARGIQGGSGSLV
jgi:hypothetical protein